MPSFVPAEHVESRFRRDVSDDLLLALVRIIGEECRSAHARASQLAGQVHRRELRPWLRRTAIHLRIEALPVSFPNVQVLTKSTSAATYCVEIRIGESLLLVARATNETEMIPRSAYRVAIANQSLQCELFEQREPPADAKIYGVVLYGGDRNETAEPSFVVVRFPTHNHAGYLTNSIDLLLMLRANSPVSDDAEIIVPTSTLQLRESHGRMKAGA